MTTTGDAPDLQQGDSGDWVTELQRQLQVLEHLHRDPSGTFDDDTRTAVEQFQSSLGQQADGIVGQVTWLALAEDVARAGGAGVVSAGVDGAPSSGHPSEDGQWVWDGVQWVGAVDGQPHSAQGEHAGDGQLSEDRQWRWDGTQWQPAGS